MTWYFFLLNIFLSDFTFVIGWHYLINVSIFITSNDPDEPIIEIPLFGEGAAPIIDINPEIYDYGPTLIGCDKTLVVEITNIGNQDLEITEINYFLGEDNVITTIQKYFLV